MYGINEILLKQERADYSEHLSHKPFELDCSMGSNPFGPYPGLALPASLISTIDYYPHSDAELTELLIQRYSPIAKLSPDMFVYSCGSIGSMLMINRALCHVGKTVIAMAPTFTAVTDDILACGSRIHYVPLCPERGYRFDVAPLLCAVDENPGAYIYIDNPNNPTGQIYPLEDMRTVVALAKERGSFVCLDEAYGDYMPAEHSGIALVNEFDNVVLVRTFSKGLGLAGARLGYTIAQPHIAAVLAKVNVPISKNSVADALAIQTLRSPWLAQTQEKVDRLKPAVTAALHNLRYAYTSDHLPITTIYCDDPTVNLEDVFLDYGVRAVTCAGYEGLGANAVRLNLHRNAERLIFLLGTIDQHF